MTSGMWMNQKYESDEPVACWRYNNVMVSAIRWCTVIKHYIQESLGCKESENSNLYQKLYLHYSYTDIDTSMSE